MKIFAKVFENTLLIEYIVVDEFIVATLVHCPIIIRVNYTLLPSKMLELHSLLLLC